MWYSLVLREGQNLLDWRKPEKDRAEDCAEIRGEWKNGARKG